MSNNWNDFGENKGLIVFSNKTHGATDWETVRIVYEILWSRLYWSYEV